ncbi:hypothetical protein [Paenibacillus lentus]|uniref:hypothetical protein n=1 Tax=Paenibacillus lentus TaxID=1338368 RepID=UPI001B8716C5|nr:hypothetical protein [Paenibacillus lentus]
MAAKAPSIKQETKKVKIGEKSFTVQTVRIPKGTPVAVGLAKGQVGSTEDFTAIVKRYGAEATINGAFFEAYGGPPDPYGMLIDNNRVMHKGGNGTTIGCASTALYGGGKLLTNAGRSLSNTLVFGSGLKK